MPVVNAEGTSSRRHPRVVALFGLLSLLTGCIPSSPVAPDGSAHDRVPPGAYYLRAIDGRRLPREIPGGERIESGFVVADSVTPGLIGFGESVARDASTSARLATGTARVIGQDYRNARIAAISWSAAPSSVAADSVLWSIDSVIVYRTGAAPSAAGAGHRLVYTRATPVDTL
jgi:hypothetical protein